MYGIRIWKQLNVARRFSPRENCTGNMLSNTEMAERI